MDGDRRTYPAGSTIFREGEPGDSAFIIERGLVEITALQRGKRIVLAHLGRRDLFGEMALVDDELRTATATALDDTEVVIISRDFFRRRFASSDPVINLFLRVVLDRFRCTHQARLSGEPGRPSVPPSRSPTDPDKERAVRELDLRHDMERAIAEGELALVYQPIVKIDDATLVGFEALIRWHHPERGRVCPNEFIGFAEKSGLIVPMGLWIVKRAMADLAELQRAHQQQSNSGEPSSLFMSINVSGQQLLEGLGLDNLVERLASGVVDPDTVKVELTESSLMDDPIEAASALRRLKAVGVHIAIDDFGIGYSSLGYLQRFPLDTLKIDQSFVSAMMDEHASMKIVRAIASLAHDLDLDIVAEGVETESQRAELIRLRCQYAQGYLFSRPQPLEEALSLVESGASLEPR